MTPDPGTVRVALLGCGQIADAHLQEIRKIHCAELVAVCDIYQDLADQAAARFEVPRAFTNLDRMLSVARPDVVHVTTPAHTHAPLAKMLLHAGVHVYVEKPFTVDIAEAEQVVSRAVASKATLCLGHDQLFDPAWLQLKKRIQDGAVGRVTHVESVLGYPIAGRFGRQVASDPDHWVRRLPGGLFQNTISHPLYRITDFLLDSAPRIHGFWSTSDSRDFPTELSASLCGSDVTGSLFFSTRIPPSRVTRVYGDEGGLEVDLDSQIVRRLRQARLPGAFGKLDVPLGNLRDAIASLGRNAWRFMNSDIHYFAGMGSLFEQFYRSILTGSEPPIGYDEMLRVTRIMDSIFDCCRQEGQKVDTPKPDSLPPGPNTEAVPDALACRPFNHR